MCVCARARFCTESPTAASLNTVQVLHCSYPNTSREKRITLNLGWQTSRDGAELDQSPERSRLLPIAIAARAAHFRAEESFEIPEGNAGAGQKVRWDQAARRAVSELS